MSRPCTVCTSPHRDQIDQALVDGTAYRAIAASYAVTPTALSRHKASHLAASLVRADLPAHVAQQFGQRDAEEQGLAITVRDQLIDLFARVHLLQDAAEERLLDPDDPTRYTPWPRAEDMRVIYQVPGADGKIVRRKERLSVLLARLEGMGYHVERVIIDGPDPTELLLKAAHQLTAQTRLLMTVLDHLYNAGEIEAFQTLVLDAIGEVAPEVRQKIEDNLVRRHPIRGAL